MRNFLILIFASLFVTTFTVKVKGQSTANIMGAWGKEENNIKTLVIFTDNVISVANYNLVDKKFNFSWGGTYTLNKKNLQLSYEWHSQDSSLVNTNAELSLVLKKNGHLSLGKLVSNLKRLDDGISGDLFGAWIISGNFSNDVVSRRPNPFLPRRTMKIVSGKYFQWISYNVGTRKFFDAGGGTQTAVNGKYVETIEYFTKTAQSIGKSVEFSYSVLDGDWRHKGQKSTGGPLDECWTKRKLIEEKFGKK